jgi:hypothetical protein
MKTALVGPCVDNPTCICARAGSCYLGDVCHSRRPNIEAPACYKDRMTRRKEKDDGKG